MQLKINNKVALNFREIDDEWNAPLQVDTLDFEITLKQKLLNTEKKVTWEQVRFFIDEILKNLVALVSKSENVFIALHKEIFGNEYEEKQGYFELYNIDIKNVNREIGSIDIYNCSFDLIFALLSRINADMDPYFHYEARFKIEYNLLTMVGVKRVVA